MHKLARIGTCAILLAMGAPAFAGSDPEADQLFCDLAGQCESGTSDAAAPAGSMPPAAVEPGGPRSGATRGFTFKRQVPVGGLSAPVATPAPAVASAAPSRIMPPAKVGASNLRLSFPSGSAMLTDADKTRLAKLAQVLDSPRLAARRTRIEGHTDAVGSARSNLDLSRRRAQSVADYLVTAGVDAGRLEVVGLGASQPLPGVPAASPDNRRVMAVLLN